MPRWRLRNDQQYRLQWMWRRQKTRCRFGINANLHELFEDDLTLSPARKPVGNGALDGMKLRTAT